MASAVVGIRAHSGWASLIAIEGPARSPRVILRRRIELVDDPHDGAARQPYHAAEPLPFPEAEQLITLAVGRTCALAREAIAELPFAASACALLLASGRALPDLAAILKSHALIHAAEGELFRMALREACEQRGIAVHGIRERDLIARCTRELAEGYQHHLNKLGRELGPPWRQDEKMATLAAWLAMTTTSERTSPRRGAAAP